MTVFVQLPAARSARLVLFLALTTSIFSSTAWAKKTATAEKIQTHEWVATWGTSLVAPAANGQGFKNQTLRLIVHPTLSGDQVRVRIANPFSNQALEIGAASIGIQDSAAEIAASSLKAITFAGKSSTLIPPNALMVSDPIAIKVTAQRNLAVSLYLPRETGPSAMHPGANQTSFVGAEGNTTTSDAKSFATTLPSWPFLNAVEVRSAKPARAIVAFGDSITDGFKSTIDANHRWPDYFHARLLAAKREIAIVNQGISGNRMLHDAAGGRPVFGPNGLSRFDRDALTVSGASHVVVLLGINDIGMGSATRSPQEEITAQDLIDGYKQMIVRAHAQGLKIVGATLTPFSQAAYFTPEGEQKRATVNTWIRDSKAFDAVIDFDRALRDPNQPSQMLAAFDSGDHLHPSDAGYKAMADSIDLTIFD